MIARLRGFDASGADLSETSVQLMAAILAAADREHLIEWRDGQPVAQDGEEIDGALRAIEDRLLTLQESPERSEAISALWRLWSQVFARYARLNGRISRLEIERRVIDAQIAACWAAGDGNKI